MQSKTFRLFISSTFSDFNQERRLLQTYVFPEIKKYCRELGKGYTFQPIDLRWGVSNEAQLDQKALELCIEEVQSSKSQPHPNFLIMAGNRYGWVPLPYAIEQTEFEAIRENVEDTTLLDMWYKLDYNQLPASYIIQKRSGEYEAYDTWVKVENSLREILQKAVEKTALTNVQKEEYFTSATEAEVIEGIFGYKTITSFQEALTHKDSNYPLLDSAHLYGYIRDVKSVEDENFNGMFIDKDVTQADQFKDELKCAIKKENLLEVEANLTKLSKDKQNGSLDYTYETIENEEDSQFVTTMIAFIKQSIDSYELEETSTPQELEEYEQERFKEDKLKLFIGREEALKAIQAYIESDNDQPLVIYGPSGMGKSALMAKAIEETKKEKVYRFVGSTATLTSSKQLVISILKAFGIEEQIKQVKNENTGQENPETIKEFYLRVHDHLKTIPDEKVIFIDAVDQLANKDDFIWLPSRLPSNLKIIISALEDDTYPEDTQYFTALKKRTSNLYKLENFEESEMLIRSILKQYDRSITETQLSYLQTIYQDVNTPLYLTIAAQEIRHWSSEDKTIDVDPNGQELAPTQKSIIVEYIENLTKLYHHDDELVKRVLSYLYLTNGLSEAELLELLSADEAFVEKMAPSTYHNNVIKELPSVIWARLHTQLKAFIKLEEKNAKETISFFHREFNDSISHQEDMQVTHEGLIPLVYILIKKYIDIDDGLSLSDKWAELYIEIVKNYYMEYEFSYEYKIDSKFKEYVEALLGLESGYVMAGIRINLDRFYHDNMRTNKSAICFRLFSYYLSSKKYFNDPESLNSYYVALTKLADSYKDIGETRQAITLEEEALRITKEQYEKDPQRWSEDYTTSLNALAVSYEKINKSGQAIMLEEEALRITKEQYEKDPQRWAKNYTTSLNALAVSYGKISKSGQAIELEEEALRITKEQYEKDPQRWREDYTKSLINLKDLYKDTGQLRESITLEEEALHIIKASEEKDLRIIKARYIKDPDTRAKDYATSLNALAVSYGKMSKSGQAIELEEEALRIKKEQYEKDPQRWREDYILYLFNLAHTYKDAGKIREAINLEEEALPIAKEQYRKYPERWMEDYILYLLTLAGSYNDTGESREAVTLAKEALRITKEQYRKDPEIWAKDYTTSLNVLSFSSQCIGEYEQAITLYKESLSITKSLYSKDPERWAKYYTKTLDNLATLYYIQGKYKKAQQLWIKCFEIREKILGEAHYDILNTLNAIISTYIELNKYKRASYYSEKYFKIIDFNNYFDDTLISIIDLFIKWYQFVQKENDTRKIEELNKFAQNAIAFYKEKFGSEYKKTIERKYYRYSQFVVYGLEYGAKETRIFQKIFIEENYDSDIKLRLSLFDRFRHFF